jgi:hypothetical protein
MFHVVEEGQEAHPGLNVKPIRRGKQFGHRGQGFVIIWLNRARTRYWRFRFRRKLSPRFMFSIEDMPACHTSACSNWNVLRPECRYEGVEECGCNKF